MIKLWKHKNNTEIAAQFFGDFLDEDNGAVSIFALWYNIVNPKNIYLINPELDRLVIKKLTDWEPFPYDENK